MRVDIYPANQKAGFEYPRAGHPGLTFSNTAEALNIDLADAFPGEENREDREIVAAELAHLGRSIFGGGAVPVVLIIPTEAPAAAAREWSGHPDPTDPANYWIDDETGERVNAETGERRAA